jgi:hypothetical protein
LETLAMTRLKSFLLALRDMIPAAAPFVLLAVALMAVAYWAHRAKRLRRAG